MIALFTLLMFVILTVLINQVAAKSLMLTGLSEDIARFQARSVSTGTGFTTNESEHITAHPARRRIVMAQMLLHSVGLVTILASGILSFMKTSNMNVLLLRAMLLVVGIAILVILFRSQRFSRWLDHIIGRVLERYTTLNVRDYDALLHLHKGFQVTRFDVEKDTWLANKTLQQLNLPKEGAIALSILRSDYTTACVPRGEYRIHAGDTLILYGKEERLKELKNRQCGRSGKKAQAKAQQDYKQTKHTEDAEQHVYEEKKKAAV